MVKFLVHKQLEDEKKRAVRNLFAKSYFSRTRFTFSISFVAYQLDLNLVTASEYFAHSI